MSVYTSVLINSVSTGGIFMFVWLQASTAKYVRTVLICVITQGVVVVPCGRYETQPIDHIFKGQKENDKLSRNVGKELPLLAA